MPAKNHVKRWWRKNSHNLPTLTISTIATISLASFGVRGIYESQTDNLTAFFESASSVSCELLALIGCTVAALKFLDKRKEVKDTAPAALIFSVLFALVPINYLGQSKSMQKAEREYAQYHGSLAEKSDLTTVNNPETYGEDAVYEARQRLQASVKPMVAPIKPECYIWAAFMYGVIMFGTAAFIRPAKETPAEERKRAMDERVAKANATKEKNKKAAAKAKPKPKRKVVRKKVANGTIDMFDFKANRKA